MKLLDPLSLVFWVRDLLYCFGTMIGPLIDMTSDVGLRITDVTYNAKVSQAVNDGQWRLSTDRHPMVVLFRSCLPLSPQVTEDNAEGYVGTFMKHLNGAPNHNGIKQL